eukprot:10187204-Alexandrium_andersonii.AAC.1
MAVRLPPSGAGPWLAPAGCPGLALLRLALVELEAGPRSWRSGSGLAEMASPLADSLRLSPVELEGSSLAALRLGGCGFAHASVFWPDAFGA